MSNHDHNSRADQISPAPSDVIEGHAAKAKLASLTWGKALSDRDRMRERRKQAAADGLCLACCKREPLPSLTVCEPCNESAKERVRKARAKLIS